MTRSFLSGILCLTLIVPSLLVAQGPDAGLTAKNSGPALRVSNPQAAAPQGQQPSSVRPNSGTTQQRRSFERETRPRRHRHISKGEVIFMAGIAGTSMGIGAIAGGGTGLAIGAIVGGWGAYAGHRIWHWLR